MAKTTEVNRTIERFDRKRIGIEWIKCKDISVVWTSAQRPYNERHAKHIADNFDPDMFDTVKVTMPNGKGVYHAIDGQHRKSAVEMLWGPDETVPCEVLPADDPARAAELFGEINSNRKAVQPITMFLVRVTAGEEIYVAINKIVKSMGYKIGYKNPAESREGSVGAVESLVSIYRTCGPDVLAMTLKCLQETWGMDANAVAAPLLRGYAAFLLEFQHRSDKKRLRETISSRYSPGNFVAVAKNYREMHGGNLTDAVKALILVNYNKGQRQDKKLVSKEGKPVK